MANQDQIKSAVENGKLLNYDACFQDSSVSNLAQQNPVNGDDLNMSLAIDKICKIYYKNPFWRGGINSSIDDRVKFESSSGWNSSVANSFSQTVQNIQTDFSNNMNQLTQNKQQQSSDPNYVTSLQNNLENAISSMRKQKEKLQVILTALQQENNSDVMKNIADVENKIKKLTAETEYYKKGKELRKEQAKDLYTRFDSNYHPSGFGSYLGYKPLSSSSQPALMFVSFFMAFIGIIILGIQIGPNLISTMTNSSSSSSSSNNWLGSKGLASAKFSGSLISVPKPKTNLSRY